MSVILFPPPFYFVFYISNLLSFIQNNFSYELARLIMGTIFLVYIIHVCTMYVYKYSVDMFLLCMIKARVRWCTCSLWRML